MPYNGPYMSTEPGDFCVRMSLQINVPSERVLAANVNLMPYVREMVLEICERVEMGVEVAAGYRVKHRSR
jgi:hypothetical protein